MNKRIILGLSGVAAALAIGASTIALTGFGMTERSDVTYMTDGPSYADVADLTRASKAVAHVRVVSMGASHTIAFDKASAVVSERPTGNPDKDKGGAQLSTTPGGAPPTGLLKTDFVVEVLDSVRGGGLKKGDRITVSQLGGQIATKRPDGTPDTLLVANAEHDPLLKVGDEELVFLNQDKDSGTYFTTGGGMGRFSVAANGTLTAVDHDSPIARIANGKPSSFLTNAVKAVN